MTSNEQALLAQMEDKALEVQDPSTSNGGCLDGAVGVFCDMFHIG